MATRRLPAYCPITPDLPRGTAPDAVAALLRGAADRGERLVQLRLPAWPEVAVRALALACLPSLRAADTALVLNGDIDGARQLGCGVQLRAAQLATLTARPVPPGQWVGASCHDAEQLRQAQAIRADFALLAPVKATPTHADAAPLGWSRFAELVAQTPLPVYALGGVGPADLARARAAGAQGVAGIRAFWP